MNATPPTDRGSTQIHIEAECVIDGFGGKFVERPMRISTVNSDLGHTFVAVQDAACRNIFLEKLRHQSRTALPLLGLYPTASPFDPQQVMSKQLLDNVGRHGGGTPDGPRCIQIDDKLEFGGLLDMQVGRPCALEDLVYVACATFEEIDEI